MGSGTEDEVVLERAMTQLRVADSLSLTANATIRPRDEWTRGNTSSALPRISIDLREGVEAPLREGSSADFSVLSTLGEGGMGRVHLAHQRSLEREVAIKTLRPNAPPVATRALMREARLTGLLEHPGVIPVHAFGVDEGARPLLVMKRIAGEHFGALLADPAHPAWGTRGERMGASLEILIHVCQTLEFAHQRGIVHRDIKPENIMVGAFGEVYLLDWGIAASASDLADDGQLVGTPAYMAPEMARGTKADVRTDVYLLGATLHHILTGQAPHDRDNVQAVLRSALASAPVEYDGNVPAELASLCNRAMHRDPASRPQSALAFRKELEDFLRHRGARALADAAGERLAELRGLLAIAPLEAEDLATAYRLANEARFGFTQALREHPESTSARDGARTTIEALIDLELRQEHPKAAGALLRELGEAPRDLVARLDEVSRRVAERARNEEKLRSLARDLDPSVQARQRMVLFGAHAVFVGLVGVMGLLARRVPTPAQMILSSVVALVVVAGGNAILGRRMATNAFNRQGIGLLQIAIAGAILNRTAGYFLGSPTHVLYIGDLVIGTVVYAAGGVTLFRGMWACVPVVVAGIAAAVRWPVHAHKIFSVAIVAALITVSVIMGRARAKGASDVPNARGSEPHL